jgi:thermitase
MLTLLLTSMLNIAFTVTPTKADSNIDEVSDQNYLKNADELNEANPQDNPPYQGKLAEENSTTRSTTEDKWNFNKTNEWAGFASVDTDSAELVIGINDGRPDSYAEITRLIAENGAELVNTVSMGGEVTAVVADIPFETASSFVEEVRATGISKYVEPNLKFQASLVPDDPFWPMQWGPAMIKADYAWNTTIGDPSVLVAVIDTGIDWNHPDLADNYVDLGYDWVHMDPDPMDDNGHGTHCAGIIAAVLNNGIGIAGLAQISIMAEKALDAYGGGYEDDLASAIIHAVDEGADILSNSWGGYGASELIHDAVIYAYDHDVLVIAAAGNEATSSKLYPAAYDEVIAVTATDSYDNPASFTNFGEWVELAAPGVDIYSTVWNDGYAYMSGTSMSTPHVAGVAALILSQFPNMTRDQVRLQLRFTADDLGDPGFDYYYGYGRVNARRAVEQASPDHDLVILDWERPRFVELGDLAIVNTTVFNFGTCNETDITVQLIANGSVVDSATIDFLETATSTTVNCSWTPTIEGTYNLTSYVLPVPGETLTANNIVTAMVRAAHFKYILFDQTHGTDSIIYYNIWVTALTERGYVVDVHTSGPITPAVLEDYAAFIIPQARYSYTSDELFALQNFVIAGGGLLVIGDDVPSVYTDLTSFAGINWVSGGVSGITADIAPHEVTQGVTSVYLDAPIAEMIVSGCAQDLVRDPMGGIMLAVSEQPGRVIGFADEGSLMDYCINLEDNLRLANNMIDWLSVRPEHDLAVTLETPPYVEPGSSSLLNVTVRNGGLSNETSIELYLFINGTTVKNVTIPELVSDSSYTMDYLWTPIIEKVLYNVTGYAVPVENETMTENNVASTYVYVGYPVKAFVLDSAGTDFPGIISTWQALSTNWYMFGDKMPFIDYSTLNKEDITYKDLAATDADVLIISCASDPGSGWEFTGSEIEAIGRYVHEGHGLVATSGTFYSMVPNNNKLAPLFGLDESTTWKISYTDLLQLQDPMHSLFTNVPNPYTFPQTATSTPSDGRWDASELIGGEYVALGHFQESAIVVFRGLVYISPLLEYGIPPYYHFHLQLLYNAITWSSYQKPEHELVVSLEAPARLEPSESTLVNATVSNFGLSNETNVELFLLFNGTIVENAMIPELPTGSSYTLSYQWTPTVEAIYNVTAYAPPVPDEEFTLNNIDMKMVLVREFVIENVLVYTDDYAVAPSERYPIVALDNLGINYTHYSDDPYGFVTALTTQPWDLVIVSHNNYYAFGNNWEELEEYVLEGGLLILSTFDIDGSHSESTTLWSTLGVQWSSDMPYPEPVYRWMPTHPIFTFPNAIGDLTSYEDGYYDDGDHVTATTGIPIAGFTTSPTTGYAAIVVGNGGRTVLMSFLVCEFRYDEDADGKLDVVELWENAIASVAVPVEHELDVTIDAPAYLKPGNSSLLNATVCNRGTNNETDVELFLLINGNAVNYTKIPKLLTGECSTISYLWTPTDEAVYNVTAYAPPVPDEEFTKNNVKSVNIPVTSIVVALFKNVNPWDHSSNEEALSLYGVPCIVFSSSDFGIIDLSQFSKVIIASDQDQIFYSDMDAYRWWFEDYVREGGVLEIHAADGGWHGGYWVGLLPGGLQWSHYSSDYVTIVDPTHPVVTTPNTITDVELDWWSASVHGYFSTYPVDSKIVITQDATGYPAYLEFEYGAGFVLASSQTLEWAYWHKYSRILENSLLYIPVRYEHDVAVISVTPSANEVLVGDTVDIAVVAENQGTSTESFNITVYGSATLASLLSSTPAGVPNEPHDADAMWVEPSSVAFSIENVSVGHLFNVTVWLNMTTDVSAYQVALHYDRIQLKAVRAGFTAASTSQFMKGHYTSTGGPMIDTSFLGNGSVLASESLYGDDYIPAPQCGSLIWIEFEIIMAPPKGGILTSKFDISTEYPDCTWVWDPDSIDISITTYDSTYTYTGVPPPQADAMWVEPSSIVFYAPMVSVGHLFNVTVWLNMTTDVFAYQVALHYNRTQLRAVRGGFTADLTSQFMEGHITSISGPVIDTSFLGPGSVLAFESLYGDDYIPAPRYGSLIWIEFEIIMEPPEGGSLTSKIDITTEYPANTFVWDADLTDIPITTHDSNYMFSSLPPYTIGTETVSDLAPYANITLTFAWNTSGVSPHDYIVWAEASVVPGENDTADNTYTDGIIKILKVPFANFTYSPQIPKAGEKITFDASASTPDGGTIINYYWNFGDGNTTTTTNPIITHVYTPGGLYNVTLTITDSEGLTDSAWKTIYILPRDIAIVDVTPSKDRTYAGRTISINVTVVNEGEVTETFAINLYYNFTSGDTIGTQTITDLIPGENKTLTFVWNTTGVKPCRNYTITAITSAVLGETDIADNALASPTKVKVYMLGDLNGDGKIDGRDIALAAIAFASYPDHPRWNSDVDISGDGKIDGRDIVLIAKNFGKYCPPFPPFLWKNLNVNR